ncbi:jerky protein homolog [Sitophilus oryzae]|uniref:Jerky protein homolog n=1 Tax=Sitophilus oryzae TaxID=7048 RepID=A0A6J2XT17_SITOR|nr:jerky protein homolog [Sitophilus oryzae]
MAKNRKHLSLSDKAKILEDLKKVVGVTVLSKEYGVAKSTICSIRNRRVNILKRINNTFNVPGKMKTCLRHSECPRMEKALYKWFLKQREKNLPVTGLMIQEKAKLLHNEYKESSSFHASSGWLQKYKKRFGIRYLKISGEKLSSQPKLVDPFKRYLEVKIKDLQLSKDQIYNADETSLYWKLLPGKTYVAREEKTAPGRKTEKQRVTFLACTNAAGTHKLKPLYSDWKIQKSSIISKFQLSCSL